MTKITPTKYVAIINFGMLIIAILTVFISLSGYFLNKHLAEEQVKNFEIQNEVLTKQINNFELQNNLTIKQLEYMNNELNPDIYFIVKPKNNYYSRRGDIFTIKKETFEKDSTLLFYVNNRGNKGINIFGIHAFGTCLNLAENHVVSMLSFQSESLQSGMQKEFESNSLQYQDILNNNCTITFDLITSQGNFKTNLEIIN